MATAAPEGVGVVLLQMGIKGARVLAALCLVLSLVAGGPGSAQAQLSETDPMWSQEFWVGGFDDPVSASVVDTAGNLYVGGEFTAHNGDVMNHIAMWDGQTWSPLGAGTDGPVWSLAFDTDGLLVVGGYFTSAGGVTTGAIAKWDGADWSGYGDGLGTGDSAGAAIVIDPSGDLVVAEAIEAYDEPNRGFYATDVLVSRWDGVAWTALGGPRAIVQTEVRPLLAIDDGGNLLSSAGPSLSTWDGAAWSPVGEEAPLFNWAIKSLTMTFAGAVLVVDQSTTIRQWSEGQWSEFSSLEDEGFRPAGGFAGPSDSVYAIGEPMDLTTGPNRVYRWDGAEWQLVAEVSGGDIASLTALSDGLVTVGSFLNAGDNRGSFVASLSGSEWSDIGPIGNGAGLNGTVADIVVDSDGNVFVAGDFTRAGAVSANGMAKWDGSEWSALGDGTNGSVKTIAIDSSGGLIAGGYFTEAGGVPAADIARWDGSSWSALESGFTRRDNFSLFRNVETLATGAGGLIYAAGFFETTGEEVSVNGIAQWDGTTWKPVGEGLDGLAENLVIGPDRTLIASGDFPNAVARWNGQTWNPLGTRFAFLEPITDIAVKADGTIVAAGYFEDSYGIAHWDGFDWVRLGSDALPGGAFELPWDVEDLQDVYALEIDSSGGVVAGGRFRDAGGRSVNHLVRWDGVGWSGFGAGLDGAVTAIAFGPDGELFLGGRFVNGGGSPASRVTTLAGWRTPVIGKVSEASTVEEIVNATDYDPDNHGDVLRLYQAFFHREPDVSGAKYWIELNSDGYEIDSISKFFAATEEFNNNYEGSTNEIFLGVIYLNVLGRTHDAAGFKYWLNLLDTGQLNRGDVVRWIAANEEFINRYPYRPAAGQ